MIELTRKQNSKMSLLVDEVAKKFNLSLGKFEWATDRMFDVNTYQWKAIYPHPIRGDREINFYYNLKTNKTTFNYA